VPATTGTLRRLGREAEAEVVDHLLRLSPEDRRRRFGAHEDEAYVRAYVARPDWDRSLLLGWRQEGVLRALGELKLIDDHASRAAEVAVSVEAPFRGHGLGTELCRRLTIRARNRLVERVHMLCLLDNREAQRISRHLGGALTVYPGEVEALIRLPWPEPLSLAEEWLDEVLPLAECGGRELAGASGAG
jgi:RimJ/RimL family protein N-acetyltransferase